MVDEVFRQQVLAHAVGPDEHDVGGKPVETEEILDLGMVDLLGPGPVEVGQGLEAAQPGFAQAAL